MESPQVICEERSLSKPPVSDRIDGFLRSKQTVIVLALCCFAAVRLFIYSAAFPLFNSTDEQAHFSTIYEYARGIPMSRNLPTIEPDVARSLTLYNSAEYLTSEEILKKVNLDRPIEQLPPELRERKYDHWFNYWIRQTNYEAQGPPVYYWIAGLWYRAAEVLGASGWKLAYCVRFLNVVLLPLFIWVSYLFIRRVYPERTFAIVAIPALLAIFPQDVFFGLNRNAVSPLLAAVILYCLFRSLKQEVRPGAWLIVGALFTGLAFVTDVSNCVLFGALAMVVYVHARRSLRTGGRPPELSAVVGAIVASLLVPSIWVLHNSRVTGDITGSRAKIAMLGWTMKPWSEIFHHPLFSISGANYFLGQLIRTYWRGEFSWHGSPMRSPGADAFYVGASCLMIVVFCVHMIRRRSSGSLEWLANATSMYLLLSSVLFLAVISLLFDFHQCFYPSREYPYFVSGRIICGTLLPFAVIFTLGFEYLLLRLRSRIHPMIPFAVCCVLICVAEVVVSREVFRSPFNFFSLLRM
jgi:hypothetical protein